MITFSRFSPTDNHQATACNDLLRAALRYVRCADAEVDGRGTVETENAVGLLEQCARNFVRLCPNGDAAKSSEAE